MFLFYYIDDISDLTSEGCPPGWLTSTDVRGCYWVSNHTEDWQDARNYCQNHNSHLVSILSERENTLVQELLHRLEQFIMLLCN